ncbi:MAG: hypothetical protein HOH43_14310 [Candidatus Latescibacteria bacterium]|nr:hypothetical protein [Candidatus Latescibacterota bacterium]
MKSTVNVPDNLDESDTRIHTPPRHHIGTRSKHSYRKWIIKKTNFEPEVLLLLAIAGSLILYAVWWAMGKY